MNGALTPKNSADTSDQRPISRCQRKAAMARNRCQFCQRRDIDQPVAAHFHRHIVTAVFPFLSHLSGYPPHRGVIEQQGFNHRLQQVDQVIVAPHVCQFVRQDRL